MISFKRIPEYKFFAMNLNIRELNPLKKHMRMLEEEISLVSLVFQEDQVLKEKLKKENYQLELMK
jgi:hypothetical protein